MHMNKDMYVSWKSFDDTKGIFKSSQWKDRQNTCKKRGRQNTVQKSNVRTTSLPLKTQVIRECL
jgi:hypothetical protein